MVEDLFRSGVLRMSQVRPSDIVSPEGWGDMLHNRIMVAASVLLLLMSFKSIARLASNIFECLVMKNGSYRLEHIPSVARERNLLALAFSLPFCLAVDRFSIFTPSWIPVSNPVWSVPVLYGFIAAFLLLRLVLSSFVKLNRMNGEQRAASRHALLNFFLLIFPLLLVVIGIFTLFNVPQKVTAGLLRWGIVLLWAISVVRTTQFVAGNSNGFSTFLYLCALDLIPAGALVFSCWL